MTIEQYAYSSATLTVRVGETVTWTNHEQAAHDVVTTSAPAAFRSPLLAQGQSWSQTFTVPGTYAYYCSVHPDMRAQVIVLPAETPEPAPRRTPHRHPGRRPSPPRRPQPRHRRPRHPRRHHGPPHRRPSRRPSTRCWWWPGLVAAVTILCLLLMGARPER